MLKNILTIFCLLAWLMSGGCGDDGTTGDTGTTSDTGITGNTANPAYAETAWFFDDTVVRTIRITIDTNTLQSVVLGIFFTNDKQVYAYVPIFEIDGIIVSNVGIRSRGNSSAYKYKRQFKLSFNEAQLWTSPSNCADFPGNDGRRFRGERKLNLRASPNDPSIIREKVASYVLTAAGAATPRTGFAKVFINNEYWGLYLLFEHVDNTLLKTRYNENDGNLYKAEGGGFLTPGHEERFTLVNNGSNPDTTDLTALLAALESATIGTVGEFFDATNVLAYLAGAALAGHWDSLAMNPNNDYLYSHSDRRFRIIARDMDNTFGLGKNWGGDMLESYVYAMSNGASPLNANWNALFLKLLADPVRRTWYTDRLRWMLDNIYNQTHLCAKIDAWKALIEESVLADERKLVDWTSASSGYYTSVEMVNTAWQQSFTQRPDGWYGYDGFGDYTGGLKTWIMDRATVVALQLEAGSGETGSTGDMGENLSGSNGAEYATMFVRGTVLGAEGWNADMGRAMTKNGSHDWTITLSVVEGRLKFAQSNDMDWTGDEFGDVGNDGRATTAESSGPCALSGTVTFQFNDWTGLYSLEAQ